MAHRQGYGQNFAQGQGANQRLWSGAVSPNGQGGIASSLLGAVPGGTSMEQLAVIAKVLGNTMQASQLQNINFQAASSALQMQRNMAQQQGGLAGLASVPNALGAGLLGNGPAGLVGNQSASVLANANFQQQQRQLLLQQQQQQQQQTSLLGTPPQQRYQNVQQQARRNNKRNNAQRSRYPSGGDRGRSGSWSRDRRTPESDQRSDEGRREEEDGPEVKRSRVDATAYDPSEPTPDDDDVRNADQVPAGSDIQVTIQQGGEGRTVNDDRPGQQSPEQQKIYICYACNAKCYNLRNYEAHMTGNRHRQRMLKIQEFTQMRVQQATAHMQARMKAEQHLRKIEGQGLGSGAGSGSGSGRHSSGKGNQRKPSTKLEKHWCDTCKINFYGPIVEHRRTKDHKKSKKSSRPACHLCKVQFKSPKKMVAHCNTEEHKAKFRDAQERKKTGRDEEWFPDNPEEMVTVDAVGCFDSDDEDMVDNKEAGEEDFKEVFESNGDKLPDTVEDGEEDISGDIPAEDADVQPKMEEEQFSLADLPTQDVDLRQMTGPPPVVTNLQNQLKAPEEMQDEQAQDSISNTTPASPTPHTTPMEEGNVALEQVGADASTSNPQEMANLQTEEIEMNGEKSSLQVEVPHGADISERSSEMEVEENKEQVSTQVVEDATSAESKEMLLIQALDEENDAMVQRQESETSAQPQGTENTTALHTEETVQVQAESATTTQTEPTTEAQVLEVQNTALIQTKEIIHAQPQSVNNTTKVDAMEETQAEAPEEVVEEPLLPPYDPDCAVGQEFVIPITGYFCKLCHKFYKNEASAIVGHCKSQLHYDNVKAELEKSNCVEDRECVKGSSTTSEVEPSASSDEASSFSTKQSRHPQSSMQASASGMEEDSGVPGLAVESGRETGHRDDDVTPQMESTSSAAAGEVWPTTPSNVQAYNISSLMDSPGFEVMEVQDNSPADAAMNIRIVETFSLNFDADKTVDGLGHGDQNDAKKLMDTTVRNTEDVDDGSGNAKVPRAGTPSLMSEIEEYLTEGCDEKTADAPKVESNHKDTVEETITEDTKVVNSESDLCKQGPSTPVVPNQDMLLSSPDTPSLDKPSPARRGGRKTARKSTRGGRRK